MEKLTKAILIVTFFILCNATYTQGKAGVFNAKGLEKFEKQDYVGALKDFHSAVFYNTKMANYYYNRGRAYFHLKKYLSALYQFDIAIRKDPTVSMYYSYRGIARNRTDNKKKYAIYLKDYNKSIELDSNNAMGYKYKGISCYYMKQYNDAINLITESILIDSLDAETFYYRGISRINFNDSDGCLDIKKADQLGLKMKKNRVAQNCYLIKNKAPLNQTNNIFLANKIDSIAEFKLFYDKNTLRIERLAKTFRKLPLDRCLNKDIEIAFTIDSLGKLTSPTIFEGQFNSYLDSLVINEIMSFGETWTNYIKKKKATDIKLYIKFGVETTHTSTYNSIIRNERITDGSDRKEALLYYSRRIIIDFDHKKHCVDNEHYYNLGLKYLNKEDYKLAKSNFKNALKTSPYDLGSMYNIGVCYLKLTMPEKAKEFFNTAALLGDKDSIKMLKKFEANNY